ELALIDLLGLQRRVGVTEQLGGPADVAESAGMIPVDDLGPHDPDALGTGEHGRLHESGDGLGVENGVVMQQQDEIRLGGDRMRDGFVETARESEMVVVTQDPTLAEGLEEQLVRAVLGGVIDREDADTRVCLCGERLEALAEPLGRVSDREDDEDRGDGFGRRGVCRGCTHARVTRAASLAPGGDRNGKGAPGGPFPPSCTDVQRFFALVLLRATVFLAGRRFAVLFLAEDFLAVRRLAGDFLAADFLAVRRFAVLFLAAVFLRAVVFFRAVLFLAADFLAAVFFRATVFFRAAVLFRAALFFAVTFFRAAVFFAVTF